MDTNVISKDLLDVLTYIVGYGGYITKDILHLYKKDLKIDTCYRILKTLECEGYIKTIEYFNQLNKPTVYQVTSKATSLMGRRDAYMRRKHDPYTQRKYLTRSHYLFSLLGAGYGTKLFSSESRYDFLKNYGFSDYFLPQKIYDKKDGSKIKFVQMEDFLIEFEKKNTLAFACIDNYRHRPVSQLQFYFDRYRPMARAQIAFLDLIIVSDSALRIQNFEAAYYAKHFSRIDMIDVKFQKIPFSYSQKNENEKRKI